MILSMTSRRIAAIVSALVLVALLGGCVAVPSSDAPEPDPEAVFEAIFVHSDALEDVDGVVTSELSDGEQTLVERERIQERPYTDTRIETLESSNPDQEGVVLISNDTTRWWYYPERKQADYYVPPDAPFNDDEIRSTRAEMAESELEKYDLEYRGTDEVADRETHVLDVEPKNESVETGISVLVGDSTYVFALETVDVESEAEFRVVEHTVWIDTEYNYPLKEEIVWEGADGVRVTMTERFESVTFNSGLGDETFDFEPPDNATVEELE